MGHLFLQEYEQNYALIEWVVAFYRRLIFVKNSTHDLQLSVPRILWIADFSF